MSARYAVFFVPGDESSLARFGHSVLGRDAQARPLDAPRSDHPLRTGLVENAAHYGFHATLKAPFELASGRSVEALGKAVAALAATLEPIELSSLEAGSLEGFCALVLARGSSDDRAVNALAARCVKAMEPWRAPLSARERSRRQPEQLSERQRALFEQWGYPYVMEEFRFHMTLSSRLEPEQSSYLTWLQGLWEDTASGSHHIDRLALCYQADRQAAFIRVHEFMLGQEKNR